MKFTVRSDELAEAVNAASAGLGRTTDAILGGILIETRIGAVSFSSYNRERSICVQIDAEVHDSDEPLLVSGRLLAVVAKMLPARGDVLAVTEGSTLTISSGKANFALPLMDSTIYPEIPALDSADIIGTIGAQALRSAAAAVAPFASTDVALPEITVVHITAYDNVLALSATDRYSAVIDQVEYEATDIEATHTIDVPAPLFAAAAGAWRNYTGDLQLYWDGSLFGIAAAGATAALHTASVKFVDLQGRFPKNFTAACEINRPQLVAMLSRVSALGEGAFHKVELDIDDKRLAAQSVDTPHGQVSDELEIARFTGEPGRILFNGVRLQAALKSIETDTVTLAFNTPSLVAVYPGTPEDAYGRTDVPAPPEDLAVAVMAIKGATPATRNAA